MIDSRVPKANFMISENARAGFDKLRKAFNASSPDQAAVLSIGWGRYTPNRGEPFEAVAVTYYGESQLAEIAPAIQEVCGVQLVFIPTARDYMKFDGKVLDFDDDRGFFLKP